MAERQMSVGSERRRGFSLIELLVVIAIIAVLASILFPVFCQAREKARQSSCMSNERQLGAGLLGYVQDFDETFPNGVNIAGRQRMWPGEGWAGQCAGYIRDNGVFRCPSDATRNTSAGGSIVSFGFNTNLVGYADESDDPIPSGLLLPDLTAPTRTVLLFEVGGVVSDVAEPFEGPLPGGRSAAHLSAAGNGLDNRLYAQKDWSTSIENQYATGYLGGRRPFDPTATQFACATGRHNGGSNFLWVDGHCTWLPGSRVSSGRSASDPQCGQDNVPPLAGCDNKFRAAGTGGTVAPGAPSFAGTFSAK